MTGIDFGFREAFAGEDVNGRRDGGGNTSHQFLMEPTETVESVVDFCARNSTGRPGTDAGRRAQ